MNLPSRGERESATTTRYTGFFFDPTRVNLIRTPKRLPPALLSLLALVGFRRFPSARLRITGHLSRRLPSDSAEVGHLALAHALHQLLHLLAGLEQPVDLFNGRPRAGCD